MWAAYKNVPAAALPGGEDALGSHRLMAAAGGMEHAKVEVTRVDRHSVTFQLLLGRLATTLRGATR